ncbi:MAG: hypothetical protein KME29_34845 [Calothrix sp. FI2-JRJ7]|nr:hypothetical protein [Calothrix sp. FI2-JRJ7]
MLCPYNNIYKCKLGGGTEPNKPLTVADGFSMNCSFNFIHSLRFILISILVISLVFFHISPAGASTNFSVTASNIFRSGENKQ